MTDVISEYDDGFQDGATGLASLQNIYQSAEYAQGYADGRKKFMNEVFGID